MNLLATQQSICTKYNAGFIESKPYLRVGISVSAMEGKELPIHGLRHPQTERTTGWYIWAGEYSEDEDFFKVLCTKHLFESHPLIAKYLGLAPGWRFLITPDYEDVWEDKSLLDIEDDFS